MATYEDWDYFSDEQCDFSPMTGGFLRSILPYPLSPPCLPIEGLPAPVLKTEGQPFSALDPLPSISTVKAIKQQLLASMAKGTSAAMSRNFKPTGWGCGSPCIKLKRQHGALQCFLVSLYF